MIIDTHSSFRPEFVPPKEKIYENATEDNFLKVMNNSNVDMAVIWFIPSNPNDVSRINDWISETVAKHPDKFIGFANIYPPHEDAALKEMDRALNKLGLKGIKLHPLVQGYRMNDPSVLRVLERAREYDVPIVTHVTSPAYRPFPDYMGGLMQEVADFDSKWTKSAFLKEMFPHYNSNKFYAAHLGGIYDAIIEGSKISFQTTGACVSAIEYAYRAVGPERIVFGSDYPFNDMANEVGKIRRAQIPEEAKKMILGENARKALKI
jgi:predicted TIM-barrel fold metal-dependent hydrolase